MAANRRNCRGKRCGECECDDHSPIQRVEFSLDGQRWRGVFPTDGVADSKTEHYEVTLDGELSDRGLVLRATDSMNNVATGYVPRPVRR